MAGSYLAKRHHLPSVQDLRLVNSSQTNDSCFWRLQFRSDVQQRQDLVVYLSPDHKHLTADLYDMRVDPEEEEGLRKTYLLKSLSSGNPPSLGPANASITIIEFEDFECPFCKQLNDTLRNVILPEYGKDIKLIFRQFPLSKHLWARDAAIMSTCVAMQSQTSFWPVHDFFFLNQASLLQSNILSAATSFVTDKTSIDAEKWQHCLSGPEPRDAVDDDLELGRENGVHATPTMFINGVMVRGAVNPEQIRHAIELARQGKLLNEGQWF